MKKTTSNQIKEFWHLVYDLLRGPGSAQTYDSFLHLYGRFDDDVLNDIAALQAEDDASIELKIEAVRSKVQIAASTGMIGDNDLARINSLIDKIIEGVAHGKQ